MFYYNDVKAFGSNTLKGLKCWHVSHDAKS